MTGISREKLGEPKQCVVFSVLVVSVVEAVGLLLVLHLFTQQESAKLSSGWGELPGEAPLLTAATEGLPAVQCFSFPVLRASLSRREIEVWN